ncbi:MAG: TraR/DksA C4-type zinc finger protein [Gammaproteobacteria bacterium]|nr:TraR/DksA C4-type zinc finger protein [Gammaproteobacteria bacterium]
MTDRQRLRHRAREELDSLLAIEDTGRQAGGTVELDQSRVGRLSRMDALQSQAVARASGERRQQRIHALRRALREMDAAEFGDCQQCGEEIDPRRLENDPAVTLCIACASARER